MKFNKNRSNMSLTELEVVYINRDGKSMHEILDSWSVTMLRLNKILIGNEKLLTVFIYFIAYYLCICHQWNTDLDHIHTCTSRECWRTRGTHLYSCKSLRRGIRWHLINEKTKYNNPNADYVILEIVFLFIGCVLNTNIAYTTTEKLTFEAFYWPSNAARCCRRRRRWRNATSWLQVPDTTVRAC